MYSNLDTEHHQLQPIVINMSDAVISEQHTTFETLLAQS